jgi:hypothetical protein
MGQRFTQHNVRDGAESADGDSLPFEIGDLFYVRAGDQYVKRFVEPSHHRLERQPLDAGVRDNSCDGGIVQLPGEQRSHVERRPNDDLARFEAFFLIEAFALGDLRRQLVKAHGRDSDRNHFGGGNGSDGLRNHENYE